MKTPLKITVVLLTLTLLGWFAIHGSIDSEGPSRAFSSKPELKAAKTETAAPAIPAKESRVALPSESPADSVGAELGPPLANLRVLDEVTGEPVPFLALRLHHSAGATEDCISDSQGLVSFTRRESPLSIEIEHEGTPDDLVQSTRAPGHLKGERIPLELTGESPWQVRVPVGPTWRVELHGSPDADPIAFRAMFGSADPRKAWDKVFARPRAASTDSGEPIAGPWLRFGPLARLVGGGPRWRITLTSDDGLWSGFADVEANFGIQPLPLSIVVEARASLGGHVIDAYGQPVASNWMTLWPPGGSFNDPAKRPLTCMTDAEGNYRFAGVSPGEYRLETDLKNHEPFEQRLQLVALRAATQDVTLTAIVGARIGRVVGRVRSQSGRYDGELKASMNLREPPSLESTKVVWEDTSAGKIGCFVFEGVGEDGPQVRLFGDDLFAIDPAEAKGAPFGASELEFTVLDGGPSVEISFAAQPADGSEPLQRFELLLQTHVDTALRRTLARANDGSVRTRGFTPGERYSWRLRAEGFAPTWDETVAPAEDATRILVPRTGFGLEVVVLDAEGKALEGARVEFDSLDVGATDALGVAHLYASEPPKKVQVKWKDWLPVSGSAVSADGSWRPYQDALWVRLGPAR